MNSTRPRQVQSYPTSAAIASDAALEEHARAYAASRNQSDRSLACEAALPMVRRIASGVLRRLPSYFVSDDLIGDGCVGLLRALDSFDPAYGVSFDAWASRIIRGAMFNGLRRMDAIPERTRRDARMLDAARWNLAQTKGAAPDDHAAAAGAGLNAEKLGAVQLALLRATPVSLDAAMPGSQCGTTVGERVAAATDDPADVAARRDIERAVGAAVKALSPREQVIIGAAYAGLSTFREIGGRLGISKQRVSQIHSRTLTGLRSALAQHAD
ncbi:MAG TPA: sigma-70 family RNA polymerase sigma factor [Candidatus Eremiobacteraceae bacterium]|nr:sigma-70 family RNA polymerase sigma factor [Candidatus Eremiobacteraceae bacterium]